MNDKMAIDAEVVDKFSDPIKRLRAQMQGLGRETKEHGKTIGEGFAHADRALSKTAATVTNVLTPALGTIGIASLSVTAALAGIQAAVRSFTTNASGLGQLGRDTGIAAEKLRDIQSVLGKVGIDAGQSSAGILAFAEAARQARGGVGPLMDFLRTQGKTAEGRAYFGGIADSLMKSKDAGDAFMKALKGLEGIKNPADRRVYAEQVLRMAEAARVVEKHRGTIDEQMAKANKEAGPLTPEMVKSAEDYDRAMSGLASTMKRIGTAIAQELEGPLAKVAVTMKSFMDDERKGVTPAIVQTIRDAVAYIESVDWSGAFARLREGFGEIKTELGGAFTQLRELMAEFGAKGSGDAVSGVFKEIGTAANDTARAIRAVALSIGVMRDLKNLDFEGAGKKLTEIDRSTDTGWGKRSNAGPSKPTDAQTEALLGIITGGKPEDANRAQREAEAYRREQGKLTDEMRRLREALPDKRPGEATVQQQSFDAGNPLAGLIHRAGYGAMGAMAGVGHSLGGGRGLSALGDPHVMSRFRAFLENRGHAGGVMRPTPGGPADRVGRTLRGEAPADTGPVQGANPGDYKDVLDHIARSEGTAHKPGGGYNTSLGYGRYLPGSTERNLTGMTLDEISALGHHMRRQPGNPNSSALGRYQIVGDTMRRLQKRMGLKGTELFDEKLQDRMAAELARDRGANPRGLQQEWASLVGEKNRRAVELMQRVPRSASTVPRDRPAREAADGEGFAARQRAVWAFVRGEAGEEGSGFAADYKRRQAEADKQRFDFGGDGGKAMMDKASRSPMLNGGGANVRGDVSVIVNKPGPDTKVSTSASGNLFRDVKLNRGATMAQASQEN